MWCGTSIISRYLLPRSFGKGVRGRQRWRLLLFMPPQRVIFYVDGFNLYYCALKGHRCNWLNLSQLAKNLLPKCEIVRIKYFTARILPNPHDPNQHIRQQIYLRALATLPDVTVYFGSFLAVEKDMPEAIAWRKGVYQKVLVRKCEEKGSDVNIATHMLCDGFRNQYDLAALVTNDTDLEEPLRVIRQELGKDVALISPAKHASKRLLQYASTIRHIRKGVLVASQFSDALTDAVGTFHKPASW